MKLLKLLCLLLFAIPIFGQTNTFCPINQNCNVTGLWSFQGTVNASGNGNLGNVSLKYFPSDAVQYVSPHGSDVNDGLSEGSAKATILAARNALSGDGTIRVAAGTYTLNATLGFTATDNIYVIMNPGVIIICAMNAPTGDCIDYGQNVRLLGDGPGAQVMNGPVIKTNSLANIQNIIGPAAGLTTESSGFVLQGIDVSHQAGTVSRALVDICCADNATSFAYANINAQRGASGTFELVLIDSVNVNASSKAVANLSGKLDTLELNCNQVPGCTPLEIRGGSVTAPIMHWLFENITPEFPGTGLHNILISSTGSSVSNLSFINTHMETGSVSGDPVLLNGGIYDIKFDNVGCYNQGTSNLNCFKITDTPTKHPTAITLENVLDQPQSTGTLNFVNNAIDNVVLGTPGRNPGFLSGYVFQNVAYWGPQATPQYYFDGGINLLVAGGAAPALTGTGACSTIARQKGAWAGQATCTGTTGASTLVITPGTAAPDGWSCSASDLTTNNALRQSAVSTTSCTISGTVNANDVLTFTVTGY